MTPNLTWWKVFGSLGYLYEGDEEKFVTKLDSRSLGGGHLSNQPTNHGVTEIHSLGPQKRAPAEFPIRYRSINPVTYL